ncbi:unnamed protein product, partial [Rotaria magnacalcarata]
YYDGIIGKSNKILPEILQQWTTVPIDRETVPL